MLDVAEVMFCWCKNWEILIQVLMQESGQAVWEDEIHGTGFVRTSLFLLQLSPNLGWAGKPGLSLA